MSCSQYKIARIFLILTNIIFLFAGLFLVVIAIFLLTDTERILISRVIVNDTPQPLFYYVALTFILSGLIISSLSVVGCWATHCNNNLLLGIFLFLLVVLLVIECVISILAAVCPRYLGIVLEREELLDTWQRYYGVPGREQFTAAVDLIQTKMKCCGIEGGNDYTATWWRLRELSAPDLFVPLSCCVLNYPLEYLDPDPVNITICQDSQADIYQLGRYTEGCMENLEMWLTEQILIGIGCAIILVIIQLSLLLFAILMCVKVGNNMKNIKLPIKNTNQHVYQHSMNKKQLFSNYST